MKMSCWIFVSASLVLLHLHILPAQCEVAFEFVTMDWDWPANSTMRSDYLRNGDYQPNMCHMSAIQVDAVKDVVFVTVPRLRAAKGVPSGLNTVHKVGPNGTPLLRPFPDWASNKLGDCNALQLPMSMALDPRTGYLYVIDIGRVGVTSDQPSNLCPAKLVVFDTRQSGRIVRRHEFPNSVVSRDSNFINDIVLDYVDPDHVTGVRYAYISDTKGEQLVVFDFKTNDTWSFKHPASMLSDEDSNITINGIQYPWPFAINGIAMSPTFNFVYYSALGSRKLWQIPTFVLRSKGADFSSYARLVGNKVSNSDAMVFGRKGLYYGALGLDAIFMWDAQQDIASEGVIEGRATIKTQKPLIQNWETIQWPDGITISDSRDSPASYLYFVAARAQLFHSGTLDFTGGQGVNFRIFKLRINDDSYLSDKSVGDARPLFPIVG